MMEAGWIFTDDFLFQICQGTLCKQTCYIGTTSVNQQSVIHSLSQQAQLGFECSLGIKIAWSSSIREAVGAFKFMNSSAAIYKAQHNSRRAVPKVCCYPKIASLTVSSIWQHRSRLVLLTLLWHPSLSWKPVAKPGRNLAGQHEAWWVLWQNWLGPGLGKHKLAQSFQMVYCSYL